MSKHIFQEHLIPFGIPPSRANARVTLPLSSAQAVNADMSKLGLSASDLQPIDWRKKANLNFVKDQANCGDCWAMASTSALTDRFIVQKNIGNLNLDPVITTQCVPETLNVGCGGGSPAYAGTFFEKVGDVDTSASCPAWSEICTMAINCGASQAQPTLPTCDQLQQQCNLDNTGLKIYKAKANSTRTLAVSNSGGVVDGDQTIVNMKKELLNGPYPVCFFVPKDFMAGPVSGYKWEKTKGVFINGEYNNVLDSVVSDGMKSKLGNPKGAEWGDIISENNGAGGTSPAAHAVELVGWDVADIGGSYGRVPYWIIKNSWGSNWNDGGYFYIAMNIAPTNYNKYLGLDVPVSTWTIASTGQSTDMGSLYGSATAFDPDLSTGDGPNHQYPPKNGDDGDPRSNRELFIILGILGSVILVLGILYLLKSSTKKKRKSGK